MGNKLFEKAPVPKAYLKLAMPVVLSMVVTMIYNMVDTWFIALTGQTALIAGVSVCTPLFTLMLALGDLWGLGGSSVFSRLLGEHREEEGRRVSAFCYSGALILGVISAAALLLARRPLLQFLGAEGAAYPHAAAYFTWLSLGAPVIIFTLVPTNMMRSEGAATRSMIGSVLGVAVNIVLDPVFIFALGQGAAGAAMATVLGYICTAAYYIRYTVKFSPGLSLDPRDAKISGKTFGSLMMIGLPAAVTNFMQSVGITITNRNLLPYGNDPIAIMGIVLKTVNIAALVLVGLAFGGQPIMGYNYGAGNRVRLRQVIRFALSVTAATGIVISLVLFAGAGPLVRLFVSGTDLIRIGVPMLRLQVICITLMGLTTVIICLFQSTGKGLAAFLLSICRQGTVYALVMLVMAHLLGYRGVLAAQAVTDVLTIIIAGLLYRIFLSREIR